MNYRKEVMLSVSIFTLVRSIKLRNDSRGTARRILAGSLLVLVSVMLTNAQGQTAQGQQPNPVPAQAPAPAPVANNPDSPAAPIANPLVLRRFDSATFEAAQKAQRMILLVFTSVDSPACRMQVPTLSGVLAEADFRGFEVFQIDLSSQRELSEKFGNPGAAGLVSFRGSREVVRSQGMVKPSAIRRQLRLTM